MKRLYRLLTALFALALFVMLILGSEAVLVSARSALSLCGEVIIPSLFPFFVMTGLLSDMGLTRSLGRVLAPICSRFFGVSASGGTAFVLGVTGGYPLGASIIGDLVRRREITVQEGSRLLGFCNNSGPAFIVGAAGAGAFGNSRLGLLLYLCHVLAAATTGALLRRTNDHTLGIPDDKREAALPLSAALPESVKRSVPNMLTVCGFVVTFMVFVGLLNDTGLLPRLTGELAALTGLSLSACRALLTGLLELGGGIGAMYGFAPTAGNLALCAFLLGWGGISVHFQTAAVLYGTGIKTARHTAGRLICGVISAMYVLLFCLVFRLPRI